MKITLRTIFVIYVFAFVFFLASKPLNDPDFWFHLKTGEYIVLNGIVPTTDPFSSTFNGSPWMVHGWISAVSFHFIHAWFGYGALIFLFALLMTLAFWFVFLRCHAHPFITGFAILLGILSASTNIGVRPRVFTLLLISIFLFILERFTRSGEGKSIWLMIALSALWVNLHGGFFIGIALIGLTIVGVILDKWISKDSAPLWPRLKMLTLVLVGCVLALLVNPYGAAMLGVPVRVLQNPVYKEVVVDWLSPDFHRSEVFPFLLLFLLTTAALAISPVRPKPSEILLFLATLYSSLTSQRNIAIFALVAVPLFANYSQHWLDSSRFRELFAENSLLSRRVGVAGLLLLLPLILFAVKLKSTVYGDFRQQTMDVPLNAVDYLKQKQIVGNTFTDPKIWRNYFLWALPSNPFFIDGRDVYPDRFIREYLSIVSGRTDWHEAFDRYGVRVAIVGPKSVIARKMKDASDWQEVYRDEMTVVFTRH